MLRIVLPKGSLQEQTLELFRAADLPIKKAAREYNPSIDDPRISQVKMLRAQEIPKFVEEGYFDLGVTGLDWIKETGSDVVEIADLPYSKQSAGGVKIVIAVPNDSGIERPEDIKPGSKVTTEFMKLTKSYFKDLGIDVKIYYSYGATEAKVPDMMDVVVDLTETGETLQKNNLKIIGTVLESTTKLIANKDSYKDPKKRKAIDEIKTLLLGVLEARGKVLIALNVSEKDLQEVIDILPAMKRPTVSKLYDSDYYALETVVSKDEINILIPKLKDKGAQDILEIDITKIVK
ncbi:MAG: ATP phosphoribosyltransferase [Candidatus Hydrothermarchaeales archaeon]